MISCIGEKKAVFEGNQILLGRNIGLYHDGQFCWSKKIVPVFRETNVFAG
jgi:hypothetical protein